MPETEHRIFNRSDSFAEGWYWALRSSELRRGKTARVKLLGRELALYRGADGKVRALDAYCPHMGAHLAEGCVEGAKLRCLFHNWRFDGNGRCDEVPALGGTPNFDARTSSWPVEEKYGLIWVWTGPEPRHPVPFVPELGTGDCDYALGNRFVKNCHPSVVMINAIDAQHFNSVHNLPVRLDMEPVAINENCITFSNTTRVPETSWFTRLIKPFYKNALTYSMCYWYGSTGSVTIGPDFLHFHIIFALRLTEEGKAEGQTILVTKRRSGSVGSIVNQVLLFLTGIVGNFFAKGDTLIFRSIKFNLKTPIAADRAITRFIAHLEGQKAGWAEVALRPKVSA